MLGLLSLFHVMRYQYVVKQINCRCGNYFISNHVPNVGNIFPFETSIGQFESILTVVYLHALLLTFPGDSFTLRFKFGSGVVFSFF